MCLRYHQHKKFYSTRNIKDIPERKKSHEINLDNNLFVKDRKDKYTSNSINTFNSILIASYQKVNLQIFTPSSTVLTRKYRNIIKQNILCKY